MYRFFSCNLESGIPLAIGIQTGIKYLETGILGVESTLWNPESKTVLNSLMHQSIPPAPSPPPPRAFAPIVSPGGGAFANVGTARGPGICQPADQSRAFDTHAVSYQNKTTKKVLLEEKQIGSFVKDRNKL